MVQLLKNNRSLSVLWIGLCCFFLNANAQISYKQILDQYNFSGITINDGLPHNYINDIYKDHQGFLWLSTHNGLSRYDGYAFLNYNIASSNVRLRSNFVNQVCEDRFHRLWVASEAGLDLLDLEYNRLDTVNYSLFKSEDLSKEPVYFVKKDDHDVIWLATQRNLYSLTFDENGDVIRCAALTSRYERHSASITALELINGEVWIGYGQSVLKVKTDVDSQLRVEPAVSNTMFDEQTRINCFSAYAGAIWIGTNQGLWRYDPQTRSSKRYLSEGGKPETLSHDHITDFAITKNQELIIATRKGLNFYDPSFDGFVRLGYIGNTSERTISSNFINCLYSDGSVVWIGTELSGLDKMATRRLKARIYTNSGDDAGSLSDNPVNSIYEDSQGNLWVGNVEKGLHLKPRGSDSFVHFINQKGNPGSLSQNSVTSIIEDNRRQLWIATWGGGLNRISLASLPHPVFIRYEAGEETFKSNFVGSLCYDRMNEGIWIGTTGGLSFFDLSKNTFVKVSLSTDNLSNNSMVGMLIDNEQRLWIGMHHGLLIIDLYSFARNRKDIRYRYLEYKLDQPQTKLIEKISCIYQTSDGQIWLGSNGFGIYHLEDDRTFPYSFVNLTTQDGLCDNTVFGIGEDEKGRLWFGTNNGLSYYSREANEFVNYSRKDGLLFDQFYRNAYCKAKDGTLYWGGINGMFGLTGTNDSLAEANNKVLFTRLMVLGSSIEPGENQVLRKNITSARTVRLHERDKSFSISFSALDYENIGNLKYYYRLVDFDDQWIECVPLQPHASYTNLKSGKYIFQVKTQNPLNGQDSPVSELTIFVKPYFYKTWWFVLFVLFVVFAWIFYWYHLRISIYKSQELELREKVKERTLELEEKMTVLARQNTLLTQQKKQLVELSKRIQEITADKITFFTNITHEFRTPITLIMGPIERAMKLSREPEVKTQLELAEKNSRSLLALVNQLLDFRKVDSEKITLVKEKCHLPNFIRDVILPFKAFAQERQIDVDCLIHLPYTYYRIDGEWMRKVLVNLLSNAIKFTPDGGCVRLYLYGYEEKDRQNKLYIAVTDSGVGILEEDLQKIFDRFYQSRRLMKFPVYGQSGTGIGLYLCKKIIQEHGGKIYARNNRKKGASVRIKIPVEACGMESALLPPVVQNEWQKHPSPEKPEKEDMNQKDVLPKKTILVVEDHADMRTYIASILRSEYIVLEAENGEIAFAMLKKERVDFVVSDLMMPGVDGLELSKRIKEDLSISHIPVLILTAKISDKARIESFRIGVDEYLQKPFDEELLLVRIRNIFNGRESAKQQFSIQLNPNTLNMEENSKDNRFMKLVMKIVENSYSDPEFDVNTFASEIGMSKTLLNQKLQNLAGLSTARFIRDYRLKKSYQLIQENKILRNKNISEIAYEVGFNDPKYFSRCYHKKFGILPYASLDQ